MENLVAFPEPDAKTIRPPSRLAFALAFRAAAALVPTSTQVTVILCPWVLTWQTTCGVAPGLPFGPMGPRDPVGPCGPWPPWGPCGPWDPFWPAGPWASETTSPV